MRQKTSRKQYHLNRAIRFIRKGQIQRLTKEIKGYPHLTDCSKFMDFLHDKPEILKILLTLKQRVQETKKKQVEVETGSLWEATVEEEKVAAPSDKQVADLKEEIFKADAEPATDSGVPKLFTDLQRIAKGKE